MALYNFVVIRVYYYYYYFAIDNIIDAQSNISTFIVIMHELSPHTPKKKKKKKRERVAAKKKNLIKLQQIKKKNYSRIKKLFFKDNHNMLLIL